MKKTELKKGIRKGTALSRGNSLKKATQLTFRYKYILIIVILIILLYAIFYSIFILPQFKIHELQTKEWITELTENIVLGVNDHSKLKAINRECDFISFWYCYWFFSTKKYTAWILFNLQNKFSDVIMLNVYLFDFSTKQKTVESIPLNFKNLITEQKNNKLIIRCGEHYHQEIDFINNRSLISINTNKIRMKFELDIDDYTTNQASFLPRYQFLDTIINVKGPSTKTPGDWMSDNPYIGKIRTGKINNEIIEKNGDFWFDNFIGCNNNYLEPYTWFVVLNEDWMIYVLWFKTYNERNEIGTTKPFLIKHRKTNTFIYSGILGIECRTVPIINSINYALEPIKMTYNSNKPIGDLNYDDYNITFKSSLINISITSIKNESNQVFKFKYYKNKETDEKYSKMNEWDQKYYNVLENILFVEYVNMVNVTVDYKGNQETFVARQVIDAMYPEDYTIPTIIH
jgi:hypothetical protein